MSRFTPQELANATLEQWSSWLQHGLIAFVRKGSPEQRMQALAPLVVDPESTSPAGEISRQIRTLGVDAAANASAAAVDTLRNWSLATDGWKGAVLLMQIAARLGSRGLHPPVVRLLSLSAALPQAAANEVAYIAVRVAADRFKYSEIFGLAQIMWKTELITPDLAADLAVILTREDFGGLSNLPVTLAKILPALSVPPHDGQYAKKIGAKLRQSFSVDQLMRGLKPKSGDNAEESEFRRVLFRNAAPLVDLTASAVSSDTEAEFDQRVERMTQVLGGLAFPEGTINDPVPDKES